jgi:alkylation response protein AidB-like acyl-CoA dehydrogenase
MAAAIKEFSQYLDDAKEMASRIAEVTDLIEKERRIPEEITNEMKDRGLFRLLIPRSLDGAELDHPNFLRIVYEFAKVDASTGWCVNQNNVFATNSARLSEQGAREIWTDWRNVVTNGPPAPGTLATPVDGGYRLSGRWNFSSGSPHATWLAALTPVKGSDSAESRVMLLPKNDAKMIDTWDVHGLRGTGSHGFEIKDYFVPSHRTLKMSDTSRESGPLYVIPNALYFPSGFATVALGAARTALDAAIAMATKKIPVSAPGQRVLRDMGTIQRQIGQAEAIWGAARAYLNENHARLWEGATKNLSVTTEEKIGVRLSATHAIRQAAEVVDIAYNLSGATAIFASSPVQRRFRDVHTITQQVQGQMYHYDTAGQFYLGMEPQGSI